MWSGGASSPEMGVPPDREVIHLCVELAGSSSLRFVEVFASRRQPAYSRFDKGGWWSAEEFSTARAGQEAPPFPAASTAENDGIGDRVLAVPCCFLACMANESASPQRGRIAGSEPREL